MSFWRGFLARKNKDRKDKVDVAEESRLFFFWRPFGQFPGARGFQRLFLMGFWAWSEPRPLEASISCFACTSRANVQKNPHVRKIRVRNSGAGNGCANFMDTQKNAFLLQENPCP